MILNSYALLAVFLCALRLSFGFMIAGVIWKQRRGSPTGGVTEQREADEGRETLILIAGCTLLVVGVLSWPVFYLLLRSYVPEWPGVMCIYGVTRIGEGSLGPSRYLPTLVTALQVAKPGLVFLGGGWLVLRALNRTTPNGSLGARANLLLATTIVVVVLDGVCEIAYLAIPKKEVFPVGGCCTGVVGGPDRSPRLVPESLAELGTGWWFTAYFAGNLGLLLALGIGARACDRGDPARPLLVVLPLATVVALLDFSFVVQVAAPRLLKMPDHHCPYDLVEWAPGGVAAVALFALGTFCVGWACIAGWAGRSLGSDPAVHGAVRRLLRAAFLSHAASVVLLSAELALV